MLNTGRASLQAKTGWEMLRKRENKKYLLRSIPTRPVIENSKEIAKKFKNYKTPLGLLNKPKQNQKGREREKTKIIVQNNSYLTHNRKFQKNSKKIQKISKKIQKIVKPN